MKRLMKRVGGGVIQPEREEEHEDRGRSGGVLQGVDHGVLVWF